MIEDNKEKLKELRKYYDNNTNHASKLNRSDIQISLKDKNIVKENIQYMFDDFYNRKIENIEESELDTFSDLMMKFMHKNE